MVCSDFVAVYQYISLASFSSEARSVVVCSSRSDHQLYLSFGWCYIGVSRSVCSTRVVSMCVFRECLSEVGELMQSQPAESTAPPTDETSCFISIFMQACDGASLGFSPGPRARLHNKYLITFLYVGILCDH